VHVSINKTVNQGLEEKAEGKLISFIPIDEKSKQLKYGDKIWLNIIINEIPFSTHESGFDFKKYYANKGIYHNAYVLDWDLIEKNTGIYSYILTQRDLLLRVLSEHLPTENEFAVGAALCLGNKELLSDELKNEFATVGAMHVLAVSGLHVGIIFSLLLKILSFFKTRKKLWVISKIAITVLCIWVFALLTGASPSVLRAAIMFSFITISLYSRRFRNTYNTLAAAALMLLIYDPYLLFDVGFQLSFTAVTGIVYLHPRIYKLLYFKWKVPDYFWQITSVGIAAQLATFPIGLYYFHHLPINFMLTGLFVVPFAFLILTLGIALFVTQLISSSLASLLEDAH
jgi:competence protein ComEC